MTLEKYFEENPIVAVAFSGGVDSTYLLYISQKYAKKVNAYYVKSEFQPEFEYHDVKKVADLLKAELTVINVNVLNSEKVIANPVNRCYYCKELIMNEIQKKAFSDGITHIIEGTNASDDETDRPGMKVLKQMSIHSPLRDCGLTKDNIRSLSKEIGLFTWDKPAYACLATRVATGQRITADLLKYIEKSEEFLFSLGFSNFRVRVIGEIAKLQFPADQLIKVIDQKDIIFKYLKQYFSSVLLDLESR